MTDLFKRLNKELLENEQVVACIYFRIPYTFESVEKDGLLVAMKFKTVNKVRFLKNGEGEIIGVEELKT